MLPTQPGWTVPVAEPGPATPHAAVPSLPSQLPRGQGTARPAAGLEHAEAAQPTPAPRCLRNTATHRATNITLPQVWELCLEEPREEPNRRPFDATARLAMNSSTGQCFPGQGVPSPATKTCHTPGEQDPLCQAAALESSLSAGAARAEPGCSSANGWPILSLMRARGRQNRSLPEPRLFQTPSAAADVPPPLPHI